MKGKIIPIFSCDLHGECTHGRFCQKQSVRVCLHCSDFDDTGTYPTAAPKPFIPTNEQIPDNRKKRLLITVATGDEFWRLLGLTRPFFKEYASKCDADFVALMNTTQTWPLYEKFRVHKWAGQYDQTLFVDSDCVIKSDCPNLFDMIPVGQVGLHDDTPLNSGHEWLFRSWQRVMDSQQVFRPLDKPHVTLNSGVVMCDRDTAFIWSPPEKPLPEIHEAEQVWVQGTIQDRCMDVFKLPRAFNEQWYSQSCEPGSSPEKWKRLADEAHIVHFAGCPNRFEEIRAFIERLK